MGSTNVFVQFFRAPNLVIRQLVTLHRRLRAVSFFAELIEKVVCFSAAQLRLDARLIEL